MTTKLRYYFITLLGLCISGIALAADIGPGSADQISFLNPPLTDKSIGYLSQLFGTVGTVLHGTSGQLLGKLFEVFNLGVLAIASVFATYTIFKSVLGTAQDGEFMGKQGKSGFLAVRTCLGVGLLAPVFSGYSAIQVLVMWVVIHGVGFADAAWARALNYIKQTGQVYTAPQDDLTQAMLFNSAYFLSAYICSEASKKSADKFNQDIEDAKQKAASAGGTQPMQLAPGSHSYVPFFEEKATVYNFPGGVGANYAKDKCGRVTFTQSEPYLWNLSWDVIDAQKNIAIPFNYSATSSTRQDCENALHEINQKMTAEGGGSMTDVPKRKRIDDAYQACIRQTGQADEGGAREGIVQMALGLGSIAHDMVYSKNAPQPPITTTGSTAYLNDRVVAALIGAAADFINIILPQNTKASSNERMEEVFKNAANDGWIAAGSLYYELGSKQRETSKKNQTLFQADAGKKPPVDKAKYQSDFGFTSEDIIQRAISSIQSIGDPSKNNTFAGAAKAAIERTSSSNKQDTANFTLPKDLGFLAGPTSTMFSGWRDYLHSAADPMLGLQKLGFTNMNVAGGIYLASIIAAGLIGLASATVLGTGAIGVAVNVMMTILPMVIFFVSSMYASGIIMAIYVPLIPFLLFIFGAIGWVINVVEAMAAAPLVALGVTHPEGHDLLGKSEQAIMLMLGVFLRPILMVIGMLGGMLLSNIGIRMINVGFNTVAGGIVAQTGGFTLIIVQIIIELVYISIIIAVINQTYSLIYHVPDKVLRWIGSPEMGLGRPEGVGEVRQATTETGKELGGKIGEGPHNVGRRLEEKHHEGKKENAKKNVDLDSSH